MAEPVASSELPSDAILCTHVGALTQIAPTRSTFDEATLAAFNAAVESCIAGHRTRIIIDLSAIQRLASAALEAMLDAQDLASRHGGYVKTLRANAVVALALSLTGLDRRIGSMDETADSATPTPSVAPTARLGDLLIERGHLDQERLAKALVVQKRTGARLGEVLLAEKLVGEQDLLATLGEQLNVPYARLQLGLYDPAVVQMLPQKAAERLGIVPLFKVRDEVTLATADPQSMPSISEVEERLGCRARPVLARRDDVTRTINEAFQQGGFVDELIAELDEDFEHVATRDVDDADVIDEMASGSPIINTVNAIIQRAIRERASDVHIEPGRNKGKVRLRIDGALYEIMSPRMELHPALVSRLKVMANLDISEHRLPQDGRIQVLLHGRAVDLRFSSLPGLYGEKVVLRVLDKTQAILDVHKLGMDDGVHDGFIRLLGQSYGLILVTGPTGSGKTTSLYAALSYLNSIEKNIVTIEDPVEYQLDVVNQNEVRPQIDLTFARVLKHVLRQDPDIVMVGEIRERETAEIAVQAALTGHLVLSTLHTNDSAGAITRLIDMGVEPYLLSSALVGVVAQRLVRSICGSCGTSYLAPTEIHRRFGWDEAEKVKLRKGRGCADCFDSGYRGRFAIHELLHVTPDLGQLILTNPSKDAIDAHLSEAGFVSLLARGLTKAREGVTTIEEVSRVVNA